jgi:hypothetical protein
LLPVFPCLKVLHCSCFVSGANLGGDLIDSDTPGDRIGNRFRIAGDHRDADAKPMKFSDGFTGFGPNLVFHGESSE